MRPAWTLLLALGLSLSLADSPRAASFYARTSVYDGVTGMDEEAGAFYPLPPGSDPEAIEGRSASSEQSFSNAQASASATARASVGRLGVSSSVVWSVPGPILEPFAGGTAEIHDTFMLTSASHTQGLVTIALDLVGSWGVDDGRAGFILSMGLCETVASGVFGCAGISKAGVLMDGVETGDGFGHFEGGTVLPFNTPLTLSWFLDAGGYLEGPGSLQVDLSRSALWGGMTIVDEFGLPIPGVGIEAPSGIDWLEAYSVPEPATGGLVGGAFAWLRWRRRVST
jgi:hypothetical protein